MIDLTSESEYDRGTAAELMSYRASAHTSFRPPPVQAIAERARRRDRRRSTVVAAAAAVVTVLVGGVTVAAGLSGRLDRTTAAAGSPVDIASVDWANSTIQLPSPRVETACPVGPVNISGGRWPATGSHGLGAIDSSPRAVGDLNRDGRPEVAVMVWCYANGGGDGVGQLLVITEREGAFVGLDYVGPLGQEYNAVQVVGGDLVVDLTRRYSTVHQRRVYQWDGSGFTQVAGATSFPAPD